jgi:hypothetical protein
LNEAGQVVGHSSRFNGTDSLGRDAWFYDPVLHQTFALQLSRRSDGLAYSIPRYLGDDGLVLGTYTRFDTPGSGQERAFYFTVADGPHDLGALVDGGLAANGWDVLADAIRTNGLGQILGHGKLASQSSGQMAYLLTPIPEPSALVLLTVTLVALVAKRRVIPRSRGAVGPLHQPIEPDTAL